MSDKVVFQADHVVKLQFYHTNYLRVAIGSRIPFSIPLYENIGLGDYRFFNIVGFVTIVKPQILIQKTEPVYPLVLKA